MNAPRVKVRRSPVSGEWQAKLIEGDEVQPVGAFDSMPAAVTTGITAARFVAAGIPWRTS